MFKELRISGDLTILVNKNNVSHIHPRGDEMCEVFFTNGESQFVLMSMDEIGKLLG
jgi:hypothetical protein